MRKIIIAIILCSAFEQMVAQHCVPERYSETALFDSSEIVIHNNLEYGVAEHYFTSQDISLKMDVYFPDQEIDPMSARPFILNIHGGGFAGGDKNELAYESIEFARRGFVVANINYRVGWNCDNVLCINCFGSNLQKAIYCAVQDARAAMRFALDQKEEWGIDDDWMFVSGESAGSITAMLCTFWDQEEADAQVPAGFSAEVGGLDESGNDLPGGYMIKACIDQCGAIPSLADTDDNTNTPLISFHDSQDCVVPYAGGALIACLCSGFLSYNGSYSIHNYRMTLGECAELHTAPQPVFPNHCTYPKPHIVKLSSCFLKRVMCGYCMNFADDDIYATPLCSALTSTLSQVNGCTYSTAVNYDPAATNDDGSCMFDSSCTSDLNMDGIVGVEDLMIFISDYGIICNE